MMIKAGRVRNVLILETALANIYAGGFLVQVSVPDVVVNDVTSVHLYNYIDKRFFSAINLENVL